MDRAISEGYGLRTGYSEGDQLRCRANSALGASCNENSGAVACRGDDASQGYKCSDSQIGRRAGNTCDGFPGYAGGWPLAGIAWSDFPREDYECVLTGAAAEAELSYCPRWVVTTQPTPINITSVKIARAPWWSMRDCHCHTVRSTRPPTPWSLPLTASL